LVSCGVASLYCWRGKARGNEGEAIEFRNQE